MRFLTNIIVDGVLGVGTSSPSATLEVTGSIKFNSLSLATQSRIVTSDNTGNISYRNLSDFVTSITNTLSSSVNTMTSTVNGVTVTAPIVNSISASLASGNLQITVNGITSTAIALPLSSDTLLSVTSRGNETSYSLISPNLTTKSALNAAFLESHTAANALRWAWLHRSLATGTIGEDLELDAYSNAGVPTAVLYANRNNGNIGIGNTNPTQKLEVTGTTKTTNLQMTAGASNLYLAQSDASGNLTWVNPSTVVPATPTLQAVTTAGATSNVAITLTNTLAATVINGTTGFTYNGTATSGTYLRGNGTNYISSTIQLADLPSLTGNFWALNGNAIGVKKTLGSTDAFDIGFITNNTERLTILSSGNIGFGVSNPTSLFQVQNSSNAKDYLKISSTGVIEFGANSFVSGGGQLTFNAFPASAGGTISFRSANGMAANESPYFALKDNTDIIRGVFSAYSNTFAIGVADPSTGIRNGVYVVAPENRSAKFRVVPPTSSYITTTNMVEVEANHDGAIGLVVRPFSATQTANLLEIKNFSNVTKMSVDISGLIVSNNINSTTGYKYNGTAVAGNYLRGDGTNFISSAIQASDISSLGWLLGGNTVVAHGIIGTNAAYDMIFRTNTTERLRLNAAGNFGIGVINPLYKLDVDGTGRWANLTAGNAPTYLVGMNADNILKRVSTNNLFNVDNLAYLGFTNIGDPGAPTLTRIEERNVLFAADKRYTVTTSGSGYAAWSGGLESLFSTGGISSMRITPGGSMVLTINMLPYYGSGISQGYGRLFLYSGTSTIPDADVSMRMQKLGVWQSAVTSTSYANYIKTIVYFGNSGSDLIEITINNTGGSDMFLNTLMFASSRIDGSIDLNFPIVMTSNVNTNWWNNITYKSTSNLYLQGNTLFDNNNPLKWKNSSGTSVSLLNLNASNQIALAIANISTGTNTDSILSITAGGIVNKLSIASVVSTSGWALTGNAGTTAGTNFIGTTDAQDVVIKSNALEIGRFKYSDSSLTLKSPNGAYTGSIKVTDSYRMIITGSTYLQFGTNDNLYSFNFGTPVSGVTNSYALNAGDFYTNKTSTVLYGGYAGGLGFHTYGASNAFKAFAPVWSTSSSSGVIFNTMTSTVLSERMRIIENGNVGIGTSSPSAKLEVSADAIFNGIKVGLGAGNITSNLVIGTNVLTSNTTGQNNFAAGNGTLNSNSTGSNNMGFGYTALSSNTTGQYNVAIGSFPLRFNTTGYYNIAIGQSTLYTNTTGYENTSIGSEALKLSIGNRNTGIGAFSLSSTTSDYNTGIGAYSFNSLTTGANSTAIGYQAGFDLTTGTQNLILGYNSGRGLTTGSYNTIIGQNITGLSSSLSNNIIIADGQGNQRINVDASGSVGIGTSSPAKKLDVRGDVVFGTNSWLSLIDTAGGNGRLTYSGTGAFDFGTAMLFRSADGTTEHARFTSSGRLGINTQTPAAKLHVKGSSTSSANKSLRVENSTSSPAMIIQDNLSVGLGTEFPVNKFSAQTLYYSTGTASQSGTTITGSGTTWTSAMVNMAFRFADGTYAGMITAFNSTTSLTVAGAATVSSQAYTIEYLGLQSTTAGTVGIGIDTPTTTLHVKNVTGTNPLRVENLPSSTDVTGYEIMFPNSSGVIGTASFKNFNIYNNAYRGWVKVTTNYSVQNLDSVISVANQTNNVTITLPQASAHPFRVITIKRVKTAGDTLASTGNVTISATTNTTSQAGNVEDSNGSFGASTSLGAQGSMGWGITFISNGSEWEQIGN